MDYEIPDQHVHVNLYPRPSARPVSVCSTSKSTCVVIYILHRSLVYICTYIHMYIYIYLYIRIHLYKYICNYVLVYSTSKST